MYQKLYIDKDIEHLISEKIEKVFCDCRRSEYK